MSDPSDKAAELGKTESPNITDIHAELLFFLKEKTAEVRKMKRKFLARNTEYNSIDELVIPAKFVEKAAKARKRRRAGKILIGEIYFSFQLQNYVMSEIDSLLSQQLEEQEGIDNSSRKFSFTERLEGWIIERAMRTTGCSDMYYHHLESEKNFRSVREVLDFLLYEKYPATGIKKRTMEIVEEDLNVENLINIPMDDIIQMAEDIFDESFEVEDLLASYIKLDHFGSENICCQPIDEVGDLLLYDEHVENHNGEKNKGNEEKMEVVEFLSDDNDNEEDNTRKRIKRTEYEDKLIDDDLNWEELNLSPIIKL